jgi:Arc/MetJ-type ribon-helix-helix transcriptional regulator
MSAVLVHLPDDLTRIIDRRVAEGRVASQADYVQEAVRAYAEHLEAEDRISELVERADADFEAGRYVTVSTREQSEGLHEAAMERLQNQLADDASRR